MKTPKLDDVAVITTKLRSAWLQSKRGLSIEQQAVKFQIEQCSYYITDKYCHLANARSQIRIDKENVALLYFYYVKM